MKLYIWNSYKKTRTHWNPIVYVSRLYILEGYSQPIAIISRPAVLFRRHRFRVATVRDFIRHKPRDSGCKTRDSRQYASYLLPLLLFQTNEGYNVLSTPKAPFSKYLSNFALKMKNSPYSLYPYSKYPHIYFPPLPVKYKILTSSQSNF